MGAVSSYAMARGTGVDLPCEIAVLGFLRCQPEQCA
jgi:hypothetical protein